jgi:hypothetical protein
MGLTNNIKITIYNMNNKKQNVAEQQNTEVDAVEEVKPTVDDEKRRAFLAEYRLLAEKYELDFVPILMADQQSIRAGVIISPINKTQEVPKE